MILYLSPRLSFFKDIETKGEQESAQPANTTAAESNEQNVNIYATIKNHILTGTGSLYFMNALLDLNADLPTVKSLPSNKRPRCNSLK